MSDAGCTHIHHLGGILQILLKQPPGPLDRAHRVRIAWGGGCPASAWRDFEDRFGVTITECYGQTEASSISCANSEGVVGAIGRPLPWFRIEVKDADGRRLGAGEGRGEGSLWFGWPAPPSCSLGVSCLSTTGRTSPST